MAIPETFSFAHPGWNRRRHDTVVATIKSHFLEIGLCTPAGSAREPLRLFFRQSYDALVHRCATATGPHDGAAIRDLAVAGRLSQDYVAWSTELIAWAAAFAQDGDGNGDGDNEDHKNIVAFCQRFPPPDPTAAPWDETFGLVVQSRRRFEYWRHRIDVTYPTGQAGCQGWQVMTADKERQGGESGFGGGQGQGTWA